MKPVTYTLEELKQHRKDFVAALRSGKYQQTIGALKDNLGYCCLGVACEVSGCVATPRQTETGKYSYNTFTGILPDDISAGVLTRHAQEYFGFATSTGHYGLANLMKHNDQDHWSFDQIADLIESEPEGMFNLV